MYRCEECGKTFDSPDFESWFESRPVGSEEMSDAYCPYCGSTDIEEGFTECKWEGEEECTEERCPVDCVRCELIFVPYHWLGCSYPLESSC